MSIEMNIEKKLTKFTLPVNSQEVLIDGISTGIWVGDIKVSKSNYHDFDFNIFIVGQVREKDGSWPVLINIRGNQIGTAKTGHKFISSPSKKYYSQHEGGDIWFNFNKFSASIQNVIIDQIILNYDIPTDYVYKKEEEESPLLSLMENPPTFGKEEAKVTNAKDINLADIKF